MMPFLEELSTFFGGEISPECTGTQVDIVRRIRDGTSKCPENRCLYWRYLLHLLPIDKSKWRSTLSSSIEEYYRLKESVYPSITKSVDPLSESPETLSYFEDIERTKFIQGDLDRLYMNGVDDAYFQDTRRTKILLSVLFIW
jgi:hypothetical protein